MIIAISIIASVVLMQDAALGVGETDNEVLPSAEAADGETNRRRVAELLME